MKIQETISENQNKPAVSVNPDVAVSSAHMIHWAWLEELPGAELKHSRQRGNCKSELFKVDWFYICCKYLYKLYNKNTLADFNYVKILENILIGPLWCHC